MNKKLSPQACMEAYLQKVVSQNENCAMTNKFVSCRATSECPASIVISLSDDFGRAVKAARDISAGEVLFCETPLVLTPQAGAGPTCLRCLKNITKSPRRPCEKCGGPVCPEGASCPNKYHSDQECSILENLGEKNWSTKTIPIVNAALTLVRTWINIQQDKSIIPIVMTLQSNAEIRHKRSIGRLIDSTLMPMLKTRLKLTMPREFVHHVSGIFDTNAFRVNTAGGEDCRALVPLAGMMMHDCTPNSDHWFVDGRCLVRASCFIPKGADITNNYTNCTLGTESRLKHLSFTKHFQCSCNRCQDPTELNTHVSSIKCRTCTDGLVVPPSSDTEDWKCEECQAMLPYDMANTITKASSFLAELKDPEDTVSRLEDLARLVGLQHYGTLQLLTSLARTLMTKPDEDLLEDEARDLTVITGHLLPIIGVLAPGLSLFRGELMLGNLRGRAVLAGRGKELTQSNLLPTVITPATTPQLLEELFPICEAIHKDHPKVSVVNSIRDTFTNLGLLVPRAGGLKETLCGGTPASNGEGEGASVLNGKGESARVLNGEGESVGVLNGKGEGASVLNGEGEGVSVLNGEGEGASVLNGEEEGVGVLNGEGEGVSVINGEGEGASVLNGEGEGASVLNGEGEGANVLNGEGEGASIPESVLNDAEEDVSISAAHASNGHPNGVSVESSN